VKIVVTGATGFIGRPLVAALRAQGDTVIALTRDVERAKQVLGEVEAVAVETLEAPGAWTDALAKTDAVIHLAGEPVAGPRWDARQKQRIRDSRVEATRTLVEELGKLAPADRPRALISASGTDYYPFAFDKGGFDDDEVVESDQPSDTFLGRVCRDWEAEALAAGKLGLRVVTMRTGFVLGRDGGALGKMAPAFKLFVGGRIGTGRQWVPWIHVDDVVAAYVAAVRDERYTGPINVVTASVRNADLSRAVGKALHRPSWLPVPRFAVKVVAGGEFAEYLLKGRNVVPKRLRELGFQWKHPDLDEAMRDALG
jgi:uncharacterized protein (TIGR01777 family)